MDSNIPQKKALANGKTVPLATKRVPNADRRAAPPSMRARFASHDGAFLTSREIEFGKAMERYKRLRNRPFPTFSEVLAVLESLGYRQTEAPTELP